MEQQLSEIEQKLDLLSEKTGKQIDKEAFKKKARKHYEEFGNFDNFDIQEFLTPQEKDKPQEKQPENGQQQKPKDKNRLEQEDEKDPKSSFSLSDDFTKAKDGNGNSFNAKNPYELFNKLNDQVIANNPPGKEIKMRLNLRPEEKDREDIKEACARSAIEHGIIIKGDLPQDPKFWQSFKNEYLADKKHKPEDWERLTAHMPDELLGRTPDKEKNKDNNKNKDIEQLKALSRDGINPNLSENKPEKGNNTQIKPTNMNISNMSRMKDNTSR